MRSFQAICAHRRIKGSSPLLRSKIPCVRRGRVVYATSSVRLTPNLSAMCNVVQNPSNLGYQKAHLPLYRGRYDVPLVSSRQESEEAREVKYRAPCTNWAHKFADGKTMANDKTQLGRHIWRHTVISGAPIPRRRGLTPRAANTFI